MVLTFLAEMLRKTDFDLRDLDGIEVSSASLSDCADIYNPVPMIYQVVILPIKKYDPQFGLYTLASQRRGEVWLTSTLWLFLYSGGFTDTAFIGKFVPGADKW